MRPIPCSTWLCFGVCMSLLSGCSEMPDGGPDAGHGPVVQISPASVLDFGEVPFFAGRTTQEPALQKVVVVNAGDAPLTVEPQLELGSLGPGELELMAPAEGSTGLQIGTAAGSNSVELTLRLTPKALGERSGRLRLVTNDPARPEVDLELRARIVEPPPCEYTLSPTHFGVEPGVLTEPALSVEIKNLGTTPVQQCLLTDLDLVTPPGSPLSLRLGTVSEKLLAAGDSLIVPLRVSDASTLTPGQYDAELRFHISPSSVAQVSVPISLEVPDHPCLTIAPNDLDFGTVQMTCSSMTRTFEILNACAWDEFIESVTVSGSDFELVQSPEIPPGGLKLSPGDPPLSFEMRYTPHCVGSAPGAVIVSASSAFGESTSFLGLHGKGDNQAIQTDVYTQERQPKVDILFVIDNSPSMASLQTSIASNLASLFQFIESRGVDFHVAVITADVSQGAAFLSGASDPDRVLTSSSANVETQFAAKVNVGTSGSGSPKCLQQALDALSAPLIATQNSGFLRSDAVLSVMCLTDTTDNSPLPVSDYVTDLTAITSAGPVTHFSFDAVGGFTSACPGDQGRLADAVNLANGTSANLCDSDWHLDFEPLGTGGPIGPRWRFFLTGEPDLSVSPIMVSVDGQPVSATTSTGEVVWSFDPTLNVVQFEPAWVPGPGHVIEITYHQSCFP